MNRQSKAYACALTTVAFWSTIASASKITLRYLNPGELVFFASLVSTIVLFITILVQNKWTLLASASMRNWLTAVGFGLLNPFAYYLVLFKAYDLLPAQQAQVINYTWAITLSLLSIPFLGQRIARAQWLAIGLSYCGVIVIATRGNLLGLEFDNPTGIGLALLSTVLWALYWIFNTKDQRDPVVGLFMNFLCAMPFITLYLLTGPGFRSLTIGGLTGAAYIGVFEMGLAFVLWLLALKLTDSTAKVANLIFIAPFGSLILIYFVVGEQIYYSTFVGLVLVIAGLIVQARSQQSTE